MTAELSILNKSGVVIAADSAVTIGRNNKVFNSANKLFQLSTHHPVGLMIYNNSSWMGIPLEIIVKSYSANLGDKSFPELKDYSADFIQFLKTNFFKEVNSKATLAFVTSRMYLMLERLVEEAQEKLKSKIKSKDINEPKDETEAKNLLTKEFKDFTDGILNGTEESTTLVEFETYELKDFKVEYKKVIDKILIGFYSVHSIKRTSKTTSTLYQLIFNELTTELGPYEDFSGIVIAGYGNDQIFPALSEIHLAEVFSNRLRYQSIKDREINYNTNAIVIPFAQRDMVDTFFQGVDPNLLKKFQDQIIESFEELILSIDKDFILKKEDSLREYFQKQYNKLKDKFFDVRDEIHVQPIINSISYLPKEDLIELAESLVNITSLKRKTSNDIHSVGGPVDIALISKCDGFQWIKKKSE
jgi:hypothetical protein